MAGAVLSMFRGTLVNVAVLPASSVTTTWPVTPCPSALTTSGLVLLEEATPESASLSVNGMFTLGLFQPFAVGTGDGVPNGSTGGVASRFTVTDRVVVPPADVTLQVNVSPSVSLVTALDSHPVVD